MDRGVNMRKFLAIPVLLAGFCMFHVPEHALAEQAMVVEMASANFRMNLPSKTAKFSCTLWAPDMIGITSVSMEGVPIKNFKSSCTRNGRVKLLLDGADVYSVLMTCGICGVENRNIPPTPAPFENEGKVYVSLALNGSMYYLGHFKWALQGFNFIGHEIFP